MDNKKQIDKDPTRRGLTRNAGELITLLRQQTPIPEESFRWQCSVSEAYDLLAACYCIEVEGRQRTCVFDPDTHDHILRLAKWFTDQADTHYGVMIIGGVGNGKTTLMRSVKNAMFHMNRERSGNYQLDHQLVIRNARYVTDADRFHQCLAIDDLGLEPLEKMSFGNIETPTSDVLYHRYEKRMFTVVTSNLALRPNDSGVPTIRQRYGDRLADRFNEMFIVIPFTNMSYR